MNFVIHAVQNLKTHEVEHVGFVFTKRPRPIYRSKSEEIASRALEAEAFGFDPKKYTIFFGHFKTLRKLRRQYVKDRLKSFRRRHERK